MPIADVVSRVAELETLVQRSAPQAPPAPGAFPSALTAAAAPSPSPATPVAPLDSVAQTFVPGGASGANVLAAAQGQVGQSEQPPGSNDGPALAAYRTAVAGSAAGQPWCATFASWAAAQAGIPVGDGGSGSASVAAIADWASRTGRLLPATSAPAAGDLIVFGDRHIGIVESVAPDGSLTTVEGNYGNAVSRVKRSPSEATGYVRL
ncbi:MAG: hypothetical protein QOD65_2102 [Gaiellales bacterium]|jgi:hypothetical protein|nr:hypothetical protein [Gaiellales bacterium]